MKQELVLDTATRAPQDQASRIDIARLLDESPIRRGHVVTIAILFGVLLVDGYDLHVTGQILPAIATAFGVSTASLTSAYAAQPLGQAIGGVLLSPFADSLGRKRSLVVALALFALATFASIFASTVTGFALTRFIAGALGGVLLPVAASLAADIAPQRRRAAFVGLVYAGMGVGPLLASGVIATLLDRMGWKGVYVIGALIPPLLIVPILLLAPESPLHLARRAAPAEAIARALRKLGFRTPPDARFSVAAAAGSGGGISLLAIFAEGRAAFTIMLWLTAISGLLTVTLAGLGATYFHEFAGIPVARFAAYAATAGLASIVAGLSTGFVMDRFGRYRVISVYSLASAATLFGLALFPFGSAAFVACMAASGFFTWGANVGVNILTPIVYPPRLRSTAVGWKGGVSRFASSAAPLVAGLILSRKAGIEVAMSATAAPMLLVAVFCPLLSRLEGRMKRAA